ncbi:MAG: hypothetical protein SPE19_10430 [Candidatus Faecousia sp.]|nr:hypothetical protein [Candidatus Faecousia sp.]
MIGKTNGGGKDRLRPTIYGGTTRPSNPKNGDFHLYTGTAISATELNGFMSGFPTWTMPEGFVYIGSGGAYNDSSYVNLINVRNGIHNFCPCCCYQVEGGKWYRKDAFVYRNGAWLKFSTWAQQWDGTLFYNGDQYTDITGGWTGADSYSPNLSATLMSGTITISTVSAVDLSGFSTLKFIGSGNGAQSGEYYPAKCKIFNESGGEVASLDFQNNNTYAMSVAALSGKHYVRFVATGSRGNNLNISKVWLE